jgi:hypothetical protein
VRAPGPALLLSLCLGCSGILTEDAADTTTSSDASTGGGDDGGGCDPLASTCPEALPACHPEATGSWICRTPGSGPDDGAPCQSLTDCGAGLLCAGRESLGDCPFTGCCTPICDVTGAETQCTDPAESCTSFYGGSVPDPGYEDVGICAIP